MNSKRLKIFNVHLKTLTFALICLTLAISCNDSIIESEELVTETTTAVNELKAAVVGDYYVSPKGSDSNNGSESKPFKTFSYAQSMAKAGNVIIFEDGVYTTTSNGFLSTLTKSGTSSAYITYKARNIGGAILDGQDNYGRAGFSISASYINISGFEIKGFSAVGIEIRPNASYINISDLNVHHIGRQCYTGDLGQCAFYLKTCNNVTIERTLIHNIGRYAPGENGCTNNTISYQTLDHGVYIDGASNTVIKNNIFYDINRGFSLQVYSGAGSTTSNLKFINNTCENGNPYQKAGHIILWGSSSNFVIADNIFKDHLAYTMRVYQGSYTYSNVLITNNITSGGNGSLYASTASGVTFANNTNVTDPMFTDETNHNYTLKSGSPAAKAGYNTGVTTDYANKTRSVINYGAYAATTTTTTATTSSTNSTTTTTTTTTTTAATPTAATPTAATPTTYYNIAVSATAIKNSCGTGYTGSTVTYTVAAKKYSSTISQADADAKAAADLAANKQSYANTNGTCTAIATTTTATTTPTTTTTTTTATPTTATTPTTTTTTTTTATPTTATTPTTTATTTPTTTTNTTTTPTSTTTTAATPTVYYNTSMSVSATKNSCGSGYEGSTVTYTVAANKYSSTISQADANNKAQADLNANAQNYANDNGTCTSTRTSKKKSYWWWRS